MVLAFWVKELVKKKREMKRRVIRNLRIFLKFWKAKVLQMNSWETIRWRKHHIHTPNPPFRKIILGLPGIQIMFALIDFMNEVEWNSKLVVFWTVEAKNVGNAARWRDFLTKTGRKRAYFEIAQISFIKSNVFAFPFGEQYPSNLFPLKIGKEKCLLRSLLSVQPD